MRDRIIGALDTGCRLGEMLKIQNHHVAWDTHGLLIPGANAKDGEGRRIPFQPGGRLAMILERRRFLGPQPYVFGSARGRYQATIRTGWETLVLLTHGLEPTRLKHGARVHHEPLQAIDLHWHDLRHEAACRWWARGLDLRTIQLLLGHGDVKTTMRSSNLSDEDVRLRMRQVLWTTTPVVAETA